MKRARASRRSGGRPDRHLANQGLLFRADRIDMQQAVFEGRFLNLHAIG
jgi:hypothetical protein